MAADVLAHRRIGGQRQQAAVILGQAEFARRAEHAEALDAAYLGALDLDARQFGADPRARHLHAGGDIRRATNDLQRTGFADIDGAELELVGIGVLIDAQHLGHDDTRKVGAGATAFLDFEAGHGQQMAQFVGRERGIAEAAQPGFGELHISGIASGSADRLRRTGAGRESNSAAW